MFDNLPFEIRLHISDLLPIHSTSILRISDQQSSVIVQKVDVCLRGEFPNRIPYLRTTDEFQLNVTIPTDSHVRHSRLTTQLGNTIHIVYVRNIDERKLYVYDQHNSTLSTIDMNLHSGLSSIICSFCASIVFIIMLFLRLDDKVSSVMFYTALIATLFGVMLVSIHKHRETTDFLDFTATTTDSSNISIFMLSPSSVYKVELGESQHTATNPHGWDIVDFKAIKRDTQWAQHSTFTLSQRLQLCAGLAGEVKIHGNISRFQDGQISRIKGPGVVYVVAAHEDQVVLEFHTHGSKNAIRIPTHAEWIRIFPIDSYSCALLASSPSSAHLYLVDSQRNTMTTLAEATPTQRINVTITNQQSIILPKQCSQCSQCLIVEIDSDVKLFFVGRMVR